MKKTEGLCLLEFVIIWGRYIFLPLGGGGASEGCCPQWHPGRKSVGNRSRYRAYKHNSIRRIVYFRRLDRR